MNKSTTTDTVNYIETPQIKHTIEKVDVLLEKRMREFLLARRQRRWIQTGE